MHEFDAGGSARMSSSKIWDEHVTNEETKSHMGRKQEDAYLPNIKALSRVTSNPYCEFNFKKIFTKPSGYV